MTRKLTKKEMLHKRAGRFLEKIYGDFPQIDKAHVLETIVDDAFEAGFNEASTMLNARVDQMKNAMEMDKVLSQRAISSLQKLVKEGQDELVRRMNNVSEYARRIGGLNGLDAHELSVAVDLIIKYSRGVDPRKRTDESA